MTGEAKKKGLLRQKDFALLFWGNFVSGVGNVFYSFAISFYILKISGGNAMLQGVFLAVGGAVYLVFSPLGGVIADRFDKAKILYVTDFIRGGTILACGAAVLLLKDSYYALITVLFTVTVILNLNGAMFSPASSAIIKFVVDDSEVQKASSLFSSSSSVISIIGVLLASVLYTTLGFFWITVADGVSYILSAVSETFIKCRTAQGDGTRLTLKTAVGDMIQGFRYVHGLKPVFAITVIALGVNFFLSPMYSNGFTYYCSGLTGDYLFSEFMSGETWLAVLQTVMSAGTLIASAVIGMQKQTDKCGKTAKAWLAVLAALFVLLTSAWFVLRVMLESDTYFLISLLGIGAAAGITLSNINIRINTAMIRTVDKDMIGKAGAVLSTLSQALVPIASFVGGAIISGAGLGWLFVFSSAGMAAVTIYALLNRSLNEL